MVWEFIQNQVLGMKWLNELAANGLSAVGVDVSSRIGGSIQFFIYDVIKIIEHENYTYDRVLFADTTDDSIEQTLIAKYSCFNN